MTPPPENSLAANLRSLCSHHTSIAGVCRKLNINRQQFNRYLSGASVPSLANLRKLSDFFGVDEYELMMPHADFLRTVMPRPVNRNSLGLLELAFTQLGVGGGSSPKSFAQYCGMYAVYFYSPVWSGHIVRSLTVIAAQNDSIVSKSMQKLYVPDTRQSSRVVQKFRGILKNIVDRIYLLEYETNSNDLAALTVLFPSHRKQLQYLTGLMLTVSSGGNHQPFATRSVYERLPPSATFRGELARCRLYQPDDPEIPQEVRFRLANASGGFLLADAF
ncbi:helix-turn-helix domain-containing protein [Aestuariivirga sp.]|uniref:helix-turn-helix domain-containing protein n=1 Tax=Aestuariivirga sp. TaxID=2650926 RepID=UPI003BA8F70B